MADIKYYDVILKPVVTEKSMSGMAEKKYYFYVHPEQQSLRSRMLLRRCSREQKLPALTQ